MESIRNEWAAAGVKMPKLIYWDCNARDDIILDDPTNPNITFVSGCSPILFRSVIEGKSSIDLMLDILNGERYKNVK